MSDMTMTVMPSMSSEAPMNCMTNGGQIKARMPQITTIRLPRIPTKRPLMSRVVMRLMI